MTESREIYKTLDLALRTGEVLLSSGAGAADVAVTMDSIAHACGLRGVEVDVTFTALSMSHQPSYDEPAIIQIRNVKHRDIDYEDLTNVDLIIKDLIRGEIDRDEARSRLARIVSSGHRLPRWAVTLGWGFTGLGVALLLPGSDWIVSLIAFCAAAGVDMLQRAMSRRRLPSFYKQVAGGLLATLLAAGVAATKVPVDPSLVVTAAIITLLSGLGFMGAVQDALTGYYITAGARLIEVLLATAGIIAGVSGGLSVAKMLDVPIALVPGVVGLSDLPVMSLGAGLCAASFAFASYAPLRSLLPIAFIGLVGEVVFYASLQGFGRSWASAMSAIVIGVVSYSVAGRVKVPPLVVVVSAIVPLLPGLSIYRALSEMSNGQPEGILSMATAAAIAIAVASGVILGEYFAQPLKREARRLEDRLSGPRLVGPLRARAVKRERA